MTIGGAIALVVSIKLCYNIHERQAYAGIPADFFYIYRKKNTEPQ